VSGEAPVGVAVAAGSGDRGVPRGRGRGTTGPTARAGRPHRKAPRPARPLPARHDRSPPGTTARGAPRPLAARPVRSRLRPSA